MSNGNDREPLLRRAGDVLQYFVIAGLLGLWWLSWTAHEAARESQAAGREGLIQTTAMAKNLQLQLDVLSQVVKPLLHQITADQFNSVQGEALSNRVTAVEVSVRELQISIIESLVELLEPRHSTVIGEIGQRSDRDKKDNVR